MKIFEKMRINSTVCEYKWKYEKTKYSEDVFIYIW